MLPQETQDAMSENRHSSAVVNGIGLHYVIAGEGEPVLLLPGWPQSWFAWRSVMRRLVAAGRKVIALDPRGYGDSDKPAQGYDLESSAKDIHGFLVQLELLRDSGIDVVAHDLGSWIAYAHASAYPKDVRRLVISEATMPGAKSPSGYPDEETNKKTWQFAFNRLHELPELLINGHEREYLHWIFSNKATRVSHFQKDAIDEYVRVMQIPGSVRASCSYYREAFSETGLAAMKTRLGRKLNIPIFALGGENGVGAAMLESMQQAGTDVQGGVLAGCGHFLPEEAPDDFTARILQFWRSRDVN